MDTLLILKDTITVHVVKLGDACQSCAQKAATNCNDVTFVVIICGAIVAIVLIVAVSFLAYWGIKNRRLRKEEKAERAKEKDEKWFSLRKEYQGAILDTLKPREVPTQEKTVSEEKETKQIEIKDGFKESYIEELRNCIKWIDSQMK